MEPTAYLHAIRGDAAALADAGEAAGPEARVPSCPEWTVADLLGHIGTVHRWATANCDRPPDAEYLRSTQAGIEIPDDLTARPAWVRTGAEALLDALASHPADAPCWTWAPPHTVGFWQRRMAHETAMHRVDAQLAVGAAEPIEPALAADGIDEWLAIVGRRPWVEQQISGAGETIHLHCTDVEGEWLVRLAPAGLEVERVHAKGDVAARGGGVRLAALDAGPGADRPARSARRRRGARPLARGRDLLSLSSGALVRRSRRGEARLWLERDAGSSTRARDAMPARGGEGIDAAQRGDERSVGEVRQHRAVRGEEQLPGVVAAQPTGIHLLLEPLARGGESRPQDLGHLRGEHRAAIERLAAREPHRLGALLEELEGGAQHALDLRPP